jgi:peptide chain release factor
MIVPMAFPLELPEHVLELADQWNIRPEDIAEHHTHGGGHGGQKVNKSANAVELHHAPTGINVRYHHHRGLQKNRKEAYVLIIEKIAVHEKERKHEEEEREYREQHPQGWERTPDGQRRAIEGKRHRGSVKRSRKPPEGGPSEPLASPDPLL